MKNYTEIALVLDRSGSMHPIKDDTIGGVNSFIEGQKKVKGMCRFSLHQFDDIFETVYEGISIDEAPHLNHDTYVPRNMTALLDSIGKTINSLGERLESMRPDTRPDSVLVVVMTDGHENSSTEFTRERIFEMIRHQEEKYSWEFIFLGAEQDAIDVGRSYGFKAGSSAKFTATKEGTGKVFYAVNKMSSDYRSMSEFDKEELSAGKLDLINDSLRAEMEDSK